jgi:hypothetical protein
MSHSIETRQKMVNEYAPRCICVNDVLLQNCPESFYQGGKILHALDVTKQLDGNRFAVVQDLFDHEKIMQIEKERKTEPRIFNPSHQLHYADENSGSDHSEDFERMMPLRIDRKTQSMPLPNESKLANAEVFMKQNQVNLKKYESLDVNGISLTKLSIGGFEVDMSKAAQKAGLIAPLPPAKLPIIFVEDRMNFLHHFFQGLERLIGRDVVLSIVSKKEFFVDEELILVPLIEKMMKSGWEKSDSMLTVFVKSVFIATFEPDPRFDNDDEERGFIVAANLYGLKYFECGAEAKEPDLQFWLAQNYSDFRNLYFDTFKDSGIPAFAMEGVQARYEKPKMSKVSASMNMTTVPMTEGAELTKYRHPYDDDFDTASHRSRRSKRHRKPEPTFGSMLFGTRR